MSMVFCFKDESLPMSLRFFFLLKDNYAKVFFHFIYVISKGYIDRKTICDCSYYLKKCSQLPNREVVESHRIGFDF